QKQQMQSEEQNQIQHQHQLPSGSGSGSGSSSTTTPSRQQVIQIVTPGQKRPRDDEDDGGRVTVTQVTTPTQIKSSTTTTPRKRPIRNLNEINSSPIQPTPISFIAGIQREGSAPIESRQQQTQQKVLKTVDQRMQENSLDTNNVSKTSARIYIDLLTTNFDHLMRNYKQDVWVARYYANITIPTILIGLSVDTTPPALIDCLKALASDETESIHVRLFTSHHLGIFYKHLQDDYARAITRFRKVVQWGKVIFDHPEQIPDDLNLEKLLASPVVKTTRRYMSVAISALALLEPPQSRDSSVDTSTFDKLHVHVPLIDRDPGYTSYVDNLLERLPGMPRSYTNHCAQCDRRKGNASRDAATKPAHWKGGHKNRCRSLSDFRKGDIVIVSGIELDLARDHFDFDVKGEVEEDRGSFVLEVFGQGRRLGHWKVCPIKDHGGLVVSGPSLTLKIPVEEI
ncbi:hypothetical protein HDU76_007390, partial [Blyttiomyces sp. JEL0837]